MQKKFENVFTVNFIEKKNRKFLIVNFRLLKNFLLLNSLQKKFENFLQSISLKKNFENFQKIRKFFLPKKKTVTGGRGGACSFFSSKIRHHFSLGFDIYRPQAQIRSPIPIIFWPGGSFFLCTQIVTGGGEGEIRMFFSQRIYCCIFTETILFFYQNVKIRLISVYGKGANNMSHYVWCFLVQKIPRNQVKKSHPSVIIMRFSGYKL